MNDSRTRVLTERQDATSSHLGIAQELQGNILVVLAGLGVAENLSHLQVMLATQHELHIVESLLGQERQGFFRNLHNLLSFKLGCTYAFLGEQPVLRIVLAHLEHRSVLEFYVFSHNSIV